jgi:hypothetical protein
MQVTGWNGKRGWSSEAVLARYVRYCRQLNRASNGLGPARYAPPADADWIPPVMGEVAAAIQKGDPAAVMIGIEFLEEDAGFPFGMLLKSNVARRLRQNAALDESQKEVLRRRFTDMLLRGYLPREFREYAKLFRKIGLGVHREAIERKADLSNRFVRRWCWYLLQDHEGPRPPKYLLPW